MNKSEMMRTVRQKNSSPELSLRSSLHRTGLRFKLHQRVAKVTVDILFPRPRVAVFVDGCFWHGCPLHATYPKTNTDYWQPKLNANKERDARQTERLTEEGWNVIRVWEHDCNPPSELVIQQIKDACRGRRQR